MTHASAGNIHVLVADDHAVMRAGIGAMVANAPDIAIVAEASDGAEAVRLFALHRPQLVLMDLRMPVLGGVASIRAIRSLDSNARIVALTTYDGDTDIFQALSAGACGYLVKNVLGAALVETIRETAAGGRVIPPSIANKLAEYVPRVELSGREIEVLRLVSKGLRNKEIARVLGRAETTVKIHLANILEKLSVSDRTEAVTLALRRGIIHLDD